MFAQSKALTLSLNKAPLSELIAIIESRTGYVVNMVKEEVDLSTPVTVQVNQAGIREVLTVALKGTVYMFHIEDDVIILNRKPATHNTSGMLTGQVLDAKDNTPVIGATVKAGNHGATADVKGEYTLELPEGTHSVTVSSIGYTTKRIDEVVVKGGSPVVLNIALNIQKGTLKGVEVVASARRESISSLYLKQKNNAAISDGISAEQIRVTPDNNAAQVLKRVSGLTVQEEKYVTVRGLSERYNTVLLNGSMLPSTEPNRRNFAFDIIPSGLIDNIVIHKTATPDLSSEFAGGLVQVNTKDIPAESYYNITLGTGINTNSVGKDMYSAKRGKNDYLGYDDGTKTWWKKNNWDADKYFALQDPEKIGEMGRQIPNNWGIYKYKYSPVQNYQFNIGKKLPLKNGANIGVVLGGLYRHEEVKEDEERRIYATEAYDFRGSNYVFRSSLGGVFNVAYQAKKHKIAFKNLYNHLFVNETSDAFGPMPGFFDGTLRNYLSITTINEMWQHRLEGEHALSKRGIRLDWSADKISVTRDQPDTRNSMGLRSFGHDDLYIYHGLEDRTGNLSRGLSMFNSRLDETRYNWTASIVLPLTVGNQQQRIKAGYAGTYREADFSSFGLAAIKENEGMLDTDFDKNTFGLPDFRLLAPEFIRPGYIYYTKAFYDGNAYDGFQRMHAGYLMLDANLFSKLRFIGGVRAEDNTMFVNSLFYVEGERVDNYTYHKLDWLPSANLVYSIHPKMNLRVAVSQTMSRPDFRERSAFEYFEFKTRTEYKGALGLKDARITNVDLRYEFYPATGEVLSLSLFHKYFDSPVELIASQGSGSLLYFYFNLESSVSDGIEIDFRKSLNFINPASRLLSNIYVSGNASWMKANVKYNTDALLKASNGVTGGDETELPGDSRNRPVQGLSPSIYNAGIGYVGKPIGFQVSYNRYGKRIVAGGLYPWQDEYENPRDVIDLQLNASLLKDKLTLRFNVSDLLHQDFIIYNNYTKGEPPNRHSDNGNNDPKGTRYNPDKDFSRYKSQRGVNMSFSATYNF
ncbi:TonB-dependent receptor [Chitinophaga cymbidii]|uniref:TonB-dependent receptor n=1 Tax=Chitinophaga cymbidii TaxID=1096750 RepID=A0A512RF44_9BACT|nr:TonB-dependent receptor [Chitinophaga cymbidii]GEP94264.1 TonB-dependent receptor [Chitinophaga cymbidii]